MGSVDVSTIDAGNIIVSGPNGPLAVSVINVDVGGDGIPRTAANSVIAPDGLRDAAGGGNYTVALQEGEILDTNSNAEAAGAALETGKGVLSEPPAPFRVEAETLTVVSGFVVKDNANGSGGQFLQAGGSDEQRATYMFSGVDGVYDLSIGHFDEADGQSQMSVLLNGVEFDSFV